MESVPDTFREQTLLKVRKSRVSAPNVSLVAISYSGDTIRFILATESYGGHYGPSFVTYFEEQNALISSGAIKGEPIAVGALMINK